MKRILAAVDGSSSASRALQVACELAARPGARLWIVNVISKPGISDEELEEFRHAEGGSLSDLLDSLSTQVLNAARETAERRGVEEIRLISRTGDVAETIAAIAEECAADAIVVGRRGLGGLPGLMLGSVSLKLASAAPRPVIVVP